MHVALGLWAILAAIRWGDWKNWERYYPTMLYIACMGLLYQFFSLSYFSLWTINHDFFFNDSTAKLLHILLINPLSAFIFLSNYPKENNKIKKIQHYVKWCLIFLVTEWIGNYFSLITYHNGWTFGWSVLFVIVMFLMLRLHYLKKLVALPLSVFWIIFYLISLGYINF